MKERAQILREAAEYLRTFGWRQHNAGSPNQPRCLVGALFTIQSAHEVEDLLGPLLERLHFVCSAALIRWNDQPFRTKQEVISLLEDTAFDLELTAAIQDQQAPAPQQVFVPVSLEATTSAK